MTTSQPSHNPDVAPLAPPRPALADRLALLLVWAAKLRRKPMASTGGKDYDAFYESFFEEKDVEAYDRDRRMTVRRETINRCLADRAPAPRRILDVGCGLGDVLAGLPPGHELHGVDYAEFNVRVASRRLAGRAAIGRGSIYELPFDADTFDVALCLEVLEHIEDDAAAVRDIARVLKPGGFLVAAVPYTFYWPQYLRLMGHFRHYTRDSFAALMDRNGLVVEAYLPNYPNWHQTFTRGYAMTRLKAMTAGRLFGRRSLYTFRWPWRGTLALDALAERLEPLRVRDGALNYATMPTSTFLVARKPG